MTTFTLEVRDDLVVDVIAAIFDGSPRDSSIRTFLTSDHVRALADFDETVCVRKVD